MLIKIAPQFARDTQGAVSDIVLGWTVDVTDAPALAGTDREASWAETIRSASIRAFVEAGMDRARTPDGVCLKRISFWSNDVADLVARMNAALAAPTQKLSAFVSASDWIEADKGSKSLTTVRALLQRA